jgi:hypothetical protein
MVPGGEAGQIRLAGGGCRWEKSSGSTLGPSGSRLGCWTGKGLTGADGSQRGRWWEGKVRWQSVQVATGAGHQVEEDRCTLGNLLDAAVQPKEDGARPASMIPSWRKGRPMNGIFQHRWLTAPAKTQC